jgi:RNA polymerase sigma-70 factor (ECF subfamily)
VDDAVVGDEKAFEALFHQYRQDVYRVARAVTGHHESALDAVQEAFFKVHQGLPRWKGESSLRTWIVRIAVRCAIDLRRSALRSREVTQPFTEPSYDPRPGLDAALLRTRLEELAHRLEGQQGLVLRLRLFGDLSNKEIAEQLGIHEPNVRMQLTKALRRLREML